MKIAIDVDGVLRDSVAKMVEIYNNHFNTDMNIDDVKVYDVEISFPLIQQELKMSAYDFFFVVHNRAINLESPNFKGVRRAIREARLQGHTIHIISYQPSYANQYMTALWLAEHEIEFDSLTFCTKHRKDIIDVDIMIDDNPFYFNKVNTAKCILINRSYNENTDQYPNVDGELVLTKYGSTKLERYDSLPQYLYTL